MKAPRSLVVVLGDQLDLEAAAFDGFDPAQDAVWMAEVAEESTQVWSSKPRIALFLLLGVRPQRVHEWYPVPGLSDAP